VIVSPDFKGETSLVILSLAVALSAAALVWQLNRALACLPSVYRVYLAPLQEEVAKTLPAVFLGAPLFFTHMLFGAIEAAWELLYQRRNSLYAGLAALLSHTVFGFVTASIYTPYEAVLPALAAGYLTHAAWNYTVEVLVNRGRKC